MSQQDHAKHWTQFEQLRKQKEKNTKSSSLKKKEETQESKEELAEETLLKEEVDGDHKAEPGANPSKDGEPVKSPEEEAERREEPSEKLPKPAHNRQPSLSVQSRMRSSSFRRTSVSQTPASPNLDGNKSPTLTAMSPDGDAVTDIYRKQATRLDELEKENRRLSEDAREFEKRWKTTEEELEELREASSEVADLKTKANKANSLEEECTKLKSENASLQRQCSQLQSQSSRNLRHVSSPNTVNASSSPLSDLQAQVDSKNSTIESMELEISNLRAQIDRSKSSYTSHSEQVSALENKLERAERAAGAAQRELADVKKNLERASERAVKEGSERTSAETKIRSLGREAEESKKQAEESLKRSETLEKKLVALTNLHKEADGRRQAGERERERLEKASIGTSRRLANLENDNLRLREEKERIRKRETSGADDDMDELEDEERKRLETKIRALEGEIFDLRRGVWKERRREIGSNDGPHLPTSPDNKFDDIDLSGPSPFRRQSNAAANRGHGFTNVLSSGFNAFTGGAGRESQDFLEDDDFDDDAFRQAQEDESKKRLEKVREFKRGLKDWEGWRMDIKESRAGGGLFGEIFDI
ncbi:MAG: hypothetical protein LQ342_001967 [Letrouitia transgressa]|nr:MAG: hypothetical protein LQ342_001967 [Letrouitia transgressa]